MVVEEGKLEENEEMNSVGVSDGEIKQAQTHTKNEENEYRSTKTRQSR